MSSNVSRRNDIQYLYIKCSSSYIRNLQPLTTYWISYTRICVVGAVIILHTCEGKCTSSKLNIVTILDVMSSSCYTQYTCSWIICCTSSSCMCFSSRSRIRLSTLTTSRESNEYCHCCTSDRI